MIALLGISVGSIVLPVVGWVIGVVLLWMSPIWSQKEKVAGTFVWPLGWAAPLFLPLLVVRASATVGEGSSGSDLLSGAAAIAILLAPLVVFVFLVRSLVRNERTAR